jgi:hypothetical protein
MKSDKGHLRRRDLDGMSAIAPIATDLLRHGEGRNGPVSDVVEKSDVPTER